MTSVSRNCFLIVLFLHFFFKENCLFNQKVLVFVHKNVHFIMKVKHAQKGILVCFSSPRDKIQEITNATDFFTDIP